MTTLLVLLAVGCSAAALALAFLAHERTRRQVAALQTRLDELERARTAVLELAPDDGARFAPDEPPQADVLAGRTSWIHHVVAGETGMLSLAEQAVGQVQRHLEEPYTPTDLADDLCVSLRTLERGVSVTIGCSPSQLILAMKMREAHRLLAGGQLRVSEVAYRLGFSDPAHFSRRFKSFWRKPPSRVVAPEAALNN